MADTTQQTDHPVRMGQGIVQREREGLVQASAHLPRRISQTMADGERGAKEASLASWNILQ